MSAILFKVFFAIFAVVVLGSAINASFELYKKLAKQHLDEFYNRNSETGELKAHKVFCSLYMRTRSYYDRESSLIATEDQIEKWDELVVNELSEHCQYETKNMYLMNTGRRDNDGPLTPDYFHNAEKEIFDLAYAKDFLRGRLKIV